MFMKVPRERRLRRRGPISVPVSFTVGAERKEDVEALEGSTTDYSESGLGLCSNQELKSGAVLEIECQDIWETPKTFAVKWCNRVSNHFYRIGLTVRN